MFLCRQLFHSEINICYNKLMHEIQNEQRVIYLRGLLQRYGTLSLPLGSGLNFSLIQVFQPLRLRERAADQQESDAQDEEEQRDPQEYTASNNEPQKSDE